MEKFLIFFEGIKNGRVSNQWSKLVDWEMVDPAYKDTGISKATIIYMMIALTLLLQTSMLIMYRGLLYDEYKEKVEETSEIHKLGIIEGQELILERVFVNDSIKTQFFIKFE